MIWRCPADPAFPARLVGRCERQLNLRLDTRCPGGRVARCRNGRIAPQCGIAGIRLAACICRRPIQHPPLLVAPCSITRYPFRRLLGHRKTESRTLDTPVVRSRTARVLAMGDRSVAGTATFSVNEHRHDGPQVSPTLNNDLGGEGGGGGEMSGDGLVARGSEPERKMERLISSALIRVGLSTPRRGRVPGPSVRRGPGPRARCPGPLRLSAGPRMRPRSGRRHTGPG